MLILRFMLGMQFSRKIQSSLNVPSQGNVPGIQDRAKVDWERGPCVLGTRLPETPSELYLVLKLSWLVIPAEYSLGGLTGKIKMAKACLRAAFSV